MKLINEKTFKILAVSFLFGILATGCNYIPVAGPGEIKGSKAKEMISDAAKTTALVNYSLYAALFCTTASCKTSFTVAGVISGEINTILTGISESKMYKKATVDDCVSTISSIGYVVGYSGLLCKIEEVDLIQLGPIGLP